jgi:hypothetical protein
MRFCFATGVEDVESGGLQETELTVAASRSLLDIVKAIDRGFH